jgi:DNA-binding MarR family transcriptional regulator
LPSIDNGYIPATMSTTTCHCILLRRASRKVSTYYDEALAPLGVNIGQFSLLRNIRRLEPVSLTDLAHRVELDRSTVGRNAKVLERMQLIAIGHGEDQREAVLTVTPQGYEILNKGAPLWDGVQDDIEARLGPDKTEQLRELLAAL